jgi:hypothetical protein
MENIPGMGAFLGGAMYRVGLLLCAALCAGCASSSTEIQPQYVSQIQYQHLSCQQISAEAQRVSRRVAEVSGVQDEKASSDAVATRSGACDLLAGGVLHQG